MSDDAILRKLRAADVPIALELSTEAGWNQTADDWRMLLELAPQGCLGIEIDATLVSTATLICYGHRLAWVGMVLTRIAYRGRGFARRLLMETLALADRMGIESVKLDGTDQGQPLYEKLGFRSEQPVERWARSDAGQISGPMPSEPSASNDWQAFDENAFGVGRSELVSILARHNPPDVIGQSYLLARPGRLTRYIGPCIAESAATARLLIERALKPGNKGGWSWDLFPENTAAIGLAKEFNFIPKRHLLRMVRGKDLRGQEEKIYAIAGFELG